MSLSASPHHVGRRLHYATLWLIVSGVVIASFRPLRGVGLVALVVIMMLLAAYAILHTRDGGHLARPRWLDVVLALGGAAVALGLTRGFGWSPEVAASVIGLVGALVIRGIDHRRHYFEAPLFCGAFVGITATGAVAGAGFLLGGALVAGLLWSLSRHAWVGIGGKIGVVALSGATAARFLFHLTGHHSRTAHELSGGKTDLALSLIAVVSATATYLLATKTPWGPIAASGAVNLLTFAVVNVVGAGVSSHSPALAYVVFGASFVGMTQSERLLRPGLAVPAAAVVFAFLALHFGPTLTGVGGAAGTTALLSVFSVRGAEMIARPLRSQLAVNDRVADHIEN